MEKHKLNNLVILTSKSAVNKELSERMYFWSGGIFIKSICCEMFDYFETMYSTIRAVMNG